MARWLLKSEPGTYSWDDLHARWRHRLGRRPQQRRTTAPRTMKPGDKALFYHSGADRAVVGIARIAGPPEPDGADGEWVKVRVEPVRPLPRAVTLAELKAEPALKAMELIRQSRLSVSPVRDEEWARIRTMAEG